jgi:hypothetical protein
MGDLDANGNIVYTNHAKYDARRNNNSLDTRRVVPHQTDPSFFNAGSFGTTSAGSNMNHGGLQTVYDLTGIRYADYGVEISHAGGTHTAQVWEHAYTHNIVCGIIDQGGATGTYLTQGLDKLFFVTSVGEQTSTSGTESFDSIFLPIHNMDQVFVGTYPITTPGVAISEIYESLPLGTLHSKIQLRIH